MDAAHPMTCAPWFDVGRRAASVVAAPALGNNLALAVWGDGPLRNLTFGLRRPHLAMTRGAGHAIAVSIAEGGSVRYRTIYRPDREGD